MAARADGIVVANMIFQTMEACRFTCPQILQRMVYGPIISHPRQYQHRTIAMKVITRQVRTTAYCGLCRLSSPRTFPNLQQDITLRMQVCYRSFNPGHHSGPLLCKKCEISPINLHRYKLCSSSSVWTCNDSRTYASDASTRDNDSRTYASDTSTRDNNPRSYASNCDDGIRPSPRPPWRLLFLGTDYFAMKHLEALNENRKDEHSVIDQVDVVICTEKCAVRQYALDEGLTILRWPLPDVTRLYDVAVIVSFGHLIPGKVIRMFPQGMLNVHPSCLPRWRGASPIIHTILNGDETTAISVMKILPKKFDVGPLLLQQDYSIPGGATSLQLMQLLAKEGPPLLLQVLANLSDIPGTKQPDLPTTPYAHKLNVRHSRVDWVRQTVADIDRQYRGLSHLYNLRSQWKDQVVGLSEMVPPAVMKEENIAAKLSSFIPPPPMPGTPHFYQPSGVLCIACKDGWVGFRRIVIKKAMSAAAFHNGYLSKLENRGMVLTSLENGLSYWDRTE